MTLTFHFSSEICTLYDISLHSWFHPREHYSPMWVHAEASSVKWPSHSSSTEVGEFLALAPTAVQCRRTVFKQCKCVAISALSVSFTVSHLIDSEGTQYVVYPLWSAKASAPQYHVERLWEKSDTTHNYGNALKHRSIQCLYSAREFAFLKANGSFLSL